ncbi:MAG: D-alanine--D-alanine ligase [Roseibium sp.]|uniref:D-alanine--D-alanine ligase family protein n=1 Tax=Roseibium sp. TaxID=1936156 RepID=UPI002609E0AD|nr:D-alanine--D-alanine ligase family protein [Roseibium sp.]MCV0429879.1 D-alanine--D-alanine ligase [Roseibium sp.]
MNSTDRENRLRIMILFGGRSDEHEVSILSATNVLAALNQAKFEAVPVYVSRDGTWKLGEYAEGTLSSPSDGQTVFPIPGGKGEIVSLSSSGDVLDFHPVDAVFPVLHGQWGEDGSVQGLAAVARIPLVGCGILGSANALDKEVAKRLLREAGLPVAKSVTINQQNAVSYDDLRDELGLPFFLKPATQGSSVGVGKVSSEEEYNTVLASGFELDRKMIAEEFVEAREIECGVLENPDGSLFVSRMGEIVTAGTHDFYTYDAKYVDADGADILVPADIPGDAERLMQSMALEAFRALGCDGMARVDFFLKPDGSVVINELNTIPGFTDISMYSKVMAASGISYGDLIERLIDHGLSRHEKDT